MDMGIHAEEWQPRRILPEANRVYHPFEPIGKRNHWLVNQGKIVRVVPRIVHPTLLKQIRSFGCDSNMFFKVHPDDIESLGIPGNIVCDHVVSVD